MKRRSDGMKFTVKGWFGRFVREIKFTAKMKRKYPNKVTSNWLRLIWFDFLDAFFDWDI